MKVLFKSHIRKLLLCSLIFLVSCSHKKIQTFYINDKIDIEKVKTEESGIVIIDNTDFVDTTEILSHGNKDKKNINDSKEILNLTSDLLAVKLNKGRYFYKTGLLISKKEETLCIDGNKCEDDYSPVIEGRLALIYFDIKTGEVNYIGRIKMQKRNLDVVDSFIDDKNKLFKQHSDIANAVQKKLMKKALKPIECDFLIEDKNSHKEFEKDDSHYKECLQKLNELP